jgi:hypothetical protein
MSRTHRALTVLALSLALATGTTAVAGAAPQIPSAVEDQNDRLLRSLEIGQAAATQAAVEQVRAGERAFAATAAVSVEDQNDRLLRGLEAGQAARTPAAVEEVRAGERNFDLGPVVTVAPQPIPATTGRGLDPLAALLLGLVGGLAGGAAAMAGWTTASRRHAHRAVAA